MKSLTFGKASKLALLSLNRDFAAERPTLWRMFLAPKGNAQKHYKSAVRITLYAYLNALQTVGYREFKAFYPLNFTAIIHCYLSVFFF
ncbi:MAG: hypothetical protein LBG17_02220 [Bacteroidales bacterium]|nr:hypothetical protein [Bacteroidales bacterium]